MARLEPSSFLNPVLSHFSAGSPNSDRYSLWLHSPNPLSPTPIYWWKDSAGNLADMSRVAWFKACGSKVQGLGHPSLPLVSSALTAPQPWFSVHSGLLRVFWKSGGDLQSPQGSWALEWEMITEAESAPPGPMLESFLVRLTDCESFPPSLQGREVLNKCLETITCREREAAAASASSKPVSVLKPPYCCLHWPR